MNAQIKYCSDKISKANDAHFAPFRRWSNVLEEKNWHFAALGLVVGPHVHLASPKYERTNYRPHFAASGLGLTRFHNNPEFNNLSLIVRVTSDTLKTPGHIDNPVRLIFLYIRVGLTRFNNNPEFNT